MVRSVVQQFTFFCLLTVGCLCLSLPQANAAKAIYRGVATNQWSGGCADIQALSRMSWYYNWGLTVSWLFLISRDILSKGQHN